MGAFLMPQAPGSVARRARCGTRSLRRKPR